MKITAKQYIDRLRAIGRFEEGAAGWKQIADAIKARAEVKRPSPKVFEVHHEMEVARMTYLETLEKTGKIDESVKAGKERVGL